MDVDTLIAAVYRRKPIWDKRNKGHSNRSIVDDAWKDISREMNFDEYQLRKKWKSLRDYFINEYNKRTQSSSRPRWQRFEQLSFLMAIIEPKTSYGAAGRTNETGLSNLPQAFEPIGFIKEELDASDDFASEDLHPTTPEELDVASPPESPSTIDGDVYENHAVEGAPAEKKRRMGCGGQLQEILEIEKRKLDYVLQKSGRMKDFEPEDDDLLFWKSLLPYVKRIPAHMKLPFRNCIQNVVTDFAFPRPNSSKQAQEVDHEEPNGVTDFAFQNKASSSKKPQQLDHEEPNQETLPLKEIKSRVIHSLLHKQK